MHLEAEVRQVVDAVWTSMLGMVPAAQSESPPDVPRTGARVRVTGTWEGAVVVSCGYGLAREMTARMFGGDAKTVADADLRDAMGEITNMTGGILKTLLPGPSKLELPEFCDDDGCGTHGLQSLGSTHFVVDGEPLVVTVFMRPDGAATTPDAAPRV